jgi:hypothetical protein
MTAICAPAENDFTFAGRSPSVRRVLEPLLSAMQSTGGNRDRDNAILVCHALSGSARVADWWPQMFGPANVLTRGVIVSSAST